MQRRIIGQTAGNPQYPSSAHGRLSRPFSGNTPWKSGSAMRQSRSARCPNNAVRNCQWHRDREA